MTSYESVADLAADIIWFKLLCLLPRSKQVDRGFQLLGLYCLHCWLFGHGHNSLGSLETIEGQKSWSRWFRTATDAAIGLTLENLLIDSKSVSLLHCLDWKNLVFLVCLQAWRVNRNHRRSQIFKADSNSVCFSFWPLHFADNRKVVTKQSCDQWVYDAKLSL